MTRLNLYTTTAIAALSLSAPALAAEQTINALPPQGTVTLSGTVDRVSSAQEFRLRDKTGFIDINNAGAQSAVLKEGDNVTVTGTVEKRWFGLAGTDIAATHVEVHKDLATALGDAVTQATGISMDKAEVSQVGGLPGQGMVKVTGTVATVASEKSFTLKDPTGSIDVNVESADNVVLVKGAEVTVVGYVNSGTFGKKLSATHVIVTADSGAKAPVQN